MIRPTDAVEVDALRTDRYLESLLSGADRPTGELDRGLATAAERLDRDLVRVHPSFRFEERLARRLADIAAAMRLPAAAGADGGPLVASPPLPFPHDGPDDPSSDAFDPERDGGPAAVPRPVLIGGAVASAALSIAGAAIVAWRFGRAGAADPMTRAVRAAHGTRARRGPADLEA